MKESHLQFLRCPVSRKELKLQTINTKRKKFNTEEVLIISDGILHSPNGWFYPVINGVPRLLVEAFLDYENFLIQNFPEYQEKRAFLIENYGGLIRYALKKNQRTKQSFSQEWGLFDYAEDKTWDADPAAMLERFYKETAETSQSIVGKTILDAGCGNGLLDMLLAEQSAFVIAMDLSLSVEKAFERNQSPNVLFLQGDFQNPPVPFHSFDIVQCSGVLHHSNNTELSFSCMVPCVKHTGKLSVWLYHPRKDFVHNMINSIRVFSSKLPLTFQYYLYGVTLLPISYLFKRAKGNKQNIREMMIDILDWFSPQFRWEHTIAEAESWFIKHQFKAVSVTTSNAFGFNMLGQKTPEDISLCRK
ncbi:MAG TPA: methyltransferase domain-containing protein [Flavisolibacter sp.]|jgi:SAM-dependent methyltransferase/uncharacterized protein YbaR (Trm112 family)|nr:methyltransferase domain-containing protein [Flavisolibacter sp.]